MARYKFVVMSDPVEGREDEYNDWYNNIHLHDIVSVPGFVAAQRFRLEKSVGGHIANRYLTIYEMDCDDPEASFDALTAASQSGSMFISGALNLDTVSAGIFSECSPLVSASAKAGVL